MFTFFDFETTDKNPVGAEILTGYFLTVNEKFEKITDLYIESRPELYKDDSFLIHGISKQQAMNFELKKTALRKITEYLIDRIDDYFICHANGIVFGVYGYYDWQVLKKEFMFYSSDAYYFFCKKFQNVKLISTHTMAKNILNQKKNDLATLCKQFNIKLNHHNCMSDTVATMELFKIFYEKIKGHDLQSIGHYDGVTTWNGDFLH